MLEFINPCVAIVISTCLLSAYVDAVVTPLNDTVGHGNYYTIGNQYPSTIALSTPCFEINITKCSFHRNGTALACAEWTRSIHECVQSLELAYQIHNIEPNGKQVKINGGYGPLMGYPLVKSSDSGGINVTDVTILPNETIAGMYNVDELDICTQDEFLVGIYITSGVAGGESRDATICDEAKFAIYEAVSQPDLDLPPPVNPPLDTPAGKGKGTKGPTKSPKIAKKGGKGKAAKLGGKYYEYECMSDTTYFPTQSPTKSIKLPKKSAKSPITPSPTPVAAKRDRSISDTTYFPSIAPRASKSVKKSKKSKSPKMFGDVLVKDPEPKSCDECLALMVESTNEPDDKLKEDIFYQVKILTTTNDVEDSTIESALLEVLNGYFKAELLGCGLNNPSRRRRMEITSIDMTSAVFDQLVIGGRGSIGACNETETNCRGADGRINIYYESEGDDEAAAKHAVTLAVTDLLNQNAESIASYIDVVENLLFLKVDTNRSAIVPPRPIMQSGWMLLPIIAGAMLIIYGTFIIIRERRSKSYRNFEQDHMNELLFANDQLRSDSNLKFPIPIKHKWVEVVQVDDKDENEISIEEEIIFNREALARADLKLQKLQEEGMEQSRIGSRPTTAPDDQTTSTGYTSEISNEVVQLRYYER